MLIVMDSAATADDVRRVVEAVQSLGFQAHPIPGAQRTAISVTGNRGSVESASFENLPGVAEVIPVTAPYKLVSREAKREDTVVSVGGVPVGGERVAVVAGPCAIESEKQALEIAHEVCAAGALLYRGEAFKPRTSPYSFQGLGEPGLKILKKVREETGLPIVTEVLALQPAQIRRAAELVPVGVGVCADVPARGLWRPAVPGDLLWHARAVPGMRWNGERARPRRMRFQGGGAEPIRGSNPGAAGK